MLELKIVGAEFYDEESQTFSTPDETTVTLEHSLFSLSKWESIHEKPFLGKVAKTREETQSYIACMLRGNSDPKSIIDLLQEEHYELINQYLEKKHTATWFADNQTGKNPAEVITAELIYYWMSSFSIPWETQHWHLNKLLALIRVHSAKQEKPKKKSMSEMLAERKRLNEQRRSQTGSAG